MSFLMKTGSKTERIGPDTSPGKGPEQSKNLANHLLNSSSQFIFTVSSDNVSPKTIENAIDLFRQKKVLRPALKRNVQVIESLHVFAATDPQQIYDGLSDTTFILRVPNTTISELITGTLLDYSHKKLIGECSQNLGDLSI